MESTKQIVLGSASPRRRELLQQIGLPFTIITSECEEKITSTVPAEVVQELSLLKAKDVFSKIGSGAYSAMNREKVLVIGADTIVALEDEILGKPHSKENAISMLNHLQGKIHQVYTSVSFIWEENGQVQNHTFFEVTDVEVTAVGQSELFPFGNNIYVRKKTSETIPTGTHKLLFVEISKEKWNDTCYNLYLYE